ncbi:MAG: HDOD domain-containing protein [Planctomycetaceae bacterium]|nr:HDOD domain-containing protein [Planctomycetaceae bacterium]
MAIRIDGPHQQPPQPRLVEGLTRDQVFDMLQDLSRSDLSLAEFAVKLADCPLFLNRILRLANSATRAGQSEIQNPSHACAFLGSQRLTHLLAELSADFPAPV